MVITPVWFFKINITWVTPSSLVIHVSVEIALWKAGTQSFPLYSLVYTTMMKNTGSNQEKHKML